MIKAYLTIDDSPTERTDHLTDFLSSRNISALLFVRGEALEVNPEPIIRAIQKGFVIGNHSYAHKPAGKLGLENWKQDLEACEALIEKAYKAAAIKRPGKYYRFPYIDRGDGVRVEREFDGIFRENEITTQFQEYLKALNFTQPFQNLSPVYPVGVSDCLMTYTSGDWRMNARYSGKPEERSLKQLIQQATEWFESISLEHSQILLFHDHAEILDQVCAFISFFDERGIEWLDFQN